MRIPAGVVFVSLFTVVACSPSVEKPEGTCRTAKCRAANAAATIDAGTPAVLYQAAADAGPPVPLVAPDAGRDAAPPPMTPAGTKPQVPPPNYACRDLSRCCAKIQSGIEKAACTAVVIAGKPSVCATAVIGYQIVGCGHAPFSFGSNDDDGDGNPDWVDPDSEADVTLEDYCTYYASDPVCTDVASGGADAYDTDPCVTNPSAPECQYDPFAGDGDFGDPYGGGDDPYDPYGGGGDPYDPYGGSGDPYDPYGGGDDGDPYGGGGDDGDPWWP